MTESRRVAAAVAPVHREPRPSSEQITQYVHGRRLDVLTTDQGWLRVRGPDEYEGWVHAGYVETSDDGQWTDARVSLGCTVALHGESLLPLPLGALLRRGRRIISGEAVTEKERARRFPANPTTIAESAIRLYAGAPYLWGGVTPWGADCSGFSQSVFALHGIMLPRDAALQALAGNEAGADAAALRPADLLFFSDREDGYITHVAISAGSGRIAHCALGRGGHRVEDLSRPDDYGRALLGRFRFARRIAGAGS